MGVAVVNNRALLTSQATGPGPADRARSAVVARLPWRFTMLNLLCATGIGWLVWQVATMALPADGAGVLVPGFTAALAVQALTSATWAMMPAGFTSFVTAASPALQVMATMAICWLMTQIVLHPVRDLAESRISHHLAADRWAGYYLRSPAGFLITGVFIVFFMGGAA